MMAGAPGRALVAVLAAVVAASTLLDAHEFWISVSRTRVAIGETAPFVIGFGERFPVGSPLPEAGDIPVRVFSPTGDAVPLRNGTMLRPDEVTQGFQGGGRIESCLALRIWRAPQERKSGALALRSV